jgi:predicted permease
MRRSPGFLAAAVLSLALGIGANTAIFTLIDAVMLRPLPVHQPEQLIQITGLSDAGRPNSVSYPLFHYFGDNVKSISGAAAEASAEPVILLDGSDEIVSAEWVSGGHYAMLGVEAAAGRLIQPADDTVSPASPAAVISYGYWQRRFGLNPAAIGKTFSIRNDTFTIVGVTAPGFNGTRPGRNPDITLPLAMMLTPEQRAEPTNNFLVLLARLQPGATGMQANAEVQVLWKAFLEGQAPRFPEKDRPVILRQRAGVLPAPNGFSQLEYSYSQPLFLMMGIVALVLLLACTNLSGLLLARAAARQREISIRLAIGAGRGRLVRQFLTESLALGVLGGAGGLFLAYWFSGGLVAMLANGETLDLSVAPDRRVLAFTTAISLLACLLAGLAPSAHALRANLNPALKEVRASSRWRLGKALAIAQLSISMVLIVGAALFIGTLMKLYGVDRGLRTDGILTFGVRIHQPYPPARGLAVQNALLDRLAAVPGVTSATASMVIAIGGGIWTRHVKVDGYTFRENESDEVFFNVIAPTYFATIATPLLLGREFDQRDTDTSGKAAIVNQSFARYFFGAQSPIGRRVTSVGVTYEIVGVVKDAKYQSLRSDVTKTVYIPWTQREGQQPSSYAYLVRAAAGDPLRLTRAVERAIREVDPSLRLRAPRTYASIVDQSIVAERIMAMLGGFFGLIALVVACLGTFGIMAFQVSRRVNEFGIRMALGASRNSIVSLVLREVVPMLLAGTVAGGAAAFALAGLARKLLFGVSPTQASVFAVAAAVLCAAALAAGWLPARRASRIDPMLALRHE